jgi:hypothetical protein
MLSYLDCIIFPDRCEVIEVVPSQRYVFPIFKNASSSLHFQAIENNWRIVLNQQIKKLDHIEIFLREPDQRLISGFNTFVQHIMRDNPELDRNTVIWFGKNYLFLDRHYCPQFFWLVSLSRFLSPDTVLTFRHMNHVAEITPMHVMPEGIEPATQDILQHAMTMPDIEMYQRLEQLFYDQCLDRSWTFEEILKTLQRLDPAAYDCVIGRSKRILNPIYALS